MSLLEFVEVGLSNYGSFKELVLPIRPGRHLVLGENRSSKSANSNGAGKSTPWESIVVALYKANLRGKDPSHNWTGNCKHHVVFRKDGSLYKVERSWGSKAPVDFNPRLYCNEEEISSRKSADTEKAIEALIGVSYDLFVSTIIVLQGLPMNFGIMKPTERKTIVEQLLGFDVWEDLRSEFQDSLENKALHSSQIVETFNNTREKVAAATSKLETAKAYTTVQTEQVTERVAELKSQVRRLQIKAEALGESISEMLGGQLDYAVHNQSTQLTLRVNALQTKIRELTKSIHNSVCSACGQDLPKQHQEEAKTQVEQLSAELHTTSMELVVVKDLLERVSFIKTEQSRLKSEESSKMVEVRSLLSSLQQQSQTLNISELEGELEDLVFELNHTRESAGKIEAELENLKFVDKLLLPSSPFRTKVLENYLGYINSILSSITPLLIDEVTCQLVISDNGKGLEIELRKSTKIIDYKSLSGGEKRRVDVSLLLTIQKFLIDSAGISSNLLVFDEIFDALDDQGVTGVLSCIEQLYPETTCVYVITHNISVKSQFDSILKVVKEEGVSRLEEHGVSD